MKIKVTTKTKWNVVTWPCPHPNCNGTYRATLPQLQRMNTVRCSRGHLIRVR